MTLWILRDSDWGIGRIGPHSHSGSWRCLAGLNSSFEVEVSKVFRCGRRKTVLALIGLRRSRHLAEAAIAIMLDTIINEAFRKQQSNISVKSVISAQN